MSRAKVMATYRLNEHELAQCVVKVASNYPDALSEAKATAISAVKAMVDDAYTRERVPLPGPDSAA